MSQITKQALAHSLKQILQKKTLSKVTIKDIVDDCGVNRQTFYYHFQDVYDLVDWIFHNDFDRILRDNSDYDTWQNGCRKMIDYMQENRSLILNVYHSVNRVQLEDHLKTWLRPIMVNIVKEESEGLAISQENLDFLTEIYVMLMLGLFMEWVDHDMPKGKLKLLDKMFFCLDGSIRYMLEKFVE